MASSDDASFPAADVDKELHPGHNQRVEVDSVSSDIAASKEIKAKCEANQKEKERQKRDAMQKLKSAIMVSAVIVAVAGAAFAITKKLREK
ncbi:hypothetical protein HS088_TW03G00859 [Tripterygium wilfordii]|uniref:Transmembrane protein n=1 Tax=Tripterygium wilfordii TaxID=458696 RepID=A0A7J7DVX8_TRIWF|nr:uncharacterized protein LOC119995350 [Tripterygium wilfordii]KAF5750522.1 hypothetical protein HS088_TW03G00859 [Tripterygium wilfordii]